MSVYVAALAALSKPGIVLGHVRENLLSVSFCQWRHLQARNVAALYLYLYVYLSLSVSLCTSESMDGRVVGSMDGCMDW